MAPKTRAGRGEVGESAAKKTRSSAIGGGGKGKVTRSSTIGGGGKGKVTRSSAIEGGGGKGKLTRSSAIGGGGIKGKETTSIAQKGGEKGIPTWRATKKLVVRDDSDDSSSDPSSPVARPGGEGKVTRSSAIGGGEKGIPTWRATKKLVVRDDSDDSSSDPDPARPDKETVLADCNEMKRELELQSKNELESLAAFLIGKGVRAGRTYQDTYHEALVDLIERNRDVAKTFSQQIGKYVAMRLSETARILIKLHSLKVWDRRVVEFVLGLIGDLKDIELTVLQFQAISALGDCFFHAPQEGPELVIGDSIKRLVRQWLGDSCDEYKMMKVWAQSPTWILRTDHPHSHMLTVTKPPAMVFKNHKPEPSLDDYDSFGYGYSSVMLQLRLLFKTDFKKDIVKTN
ncbi:hypothetical protein V2J09_009911 [Rumex salicifolius]